MILLGGVSVGKFIVGFPIFFVLAWLSRWLAGNALPIDYGIEYPLFCLALGLIVSNILKVPGWMVESVRTEYYIKSGLVILGSGILFFEILQAGYLGIIQASLVVLVIWYFAYWLSTKVFKLDDEFGAVIASGVSICGVSAAIATAGAVQADKKKLSYVASIVLICAIPMMILQPWIIKWTGMDHIVGGAWIGGTLDTSPSVVAAGALVSEKCMKTGVIVKFSQNVLIGVVAFILAVVWAFKRGAVTGERPSAGVIWERFPKFVLGFLVASALFSFVLASEAVNATKSVLGELRTWWFSLAFVCIGLETRFGEFIKMGGGRPAASFIIAQLVNIIWTLLLAYLLFSGLIFPQPDIK